MGKKVNDPNFVDPITGLTTPRKQANFEGLDLTPLPSAFGMEPVIHAGDIIGERKRYDDNITLKDLDDLERERALHQPWEGKAFNAVVGGIASGVLTAAEDMGYILDFDNNIKRLKGLEEVDTNIFSAGMKQMKEGLYDAMPIHRQNQEVFDWNDPGFYWSSLRGILDSAVGFAIPGMAAVKGVGVIQKGAKLATSAIRGTKAAQRAARLDKYLSAITASEPVQQMINTGLSAYITNFGEGKMMAVEQFENSLNEMKQALYEDNVLRLQQENPDLDTNEALEIAAERTQAELDGGKLEHFETIAGEQANNFMRRNKAFILTDAIGLHGLYKGKGFTRNLLSEKGLKAGAKRLGTLSSDNLLVQAGKEGAEEIGQNILQMEGEYQSLVKAGLDPGATPEDFASRIYQFATSDQALLEGMMGLFGGGPQRIFTEVMTGNIGPKSKRAYKARFEEQQAQIAANQDYLNTKLGNYAQFQAARAISLKNGQENLDKLLRDKGFVNIVTENFVRGTTEQLERSLKEIEAGVSEEQRLENGWDENYQEQATEQLAELKRMERNYTRLTRFEDQAKIFKNRETRLLLEKDRQTLQDALDETDAEIEIAETPNPQLLDAKEYYESNLKTVKDKIQQEDRAYQRMTSSRYQNAKKAQDRRSARELKDSMQRAKNETKANDSKKKNDNANQNVEAKQEATAQQTKAEAKTEAAREEERRKKEDVDPNLVQEPEEDISAFAGEEPADVTPTEEPAEEGPDVDQLTDKDVPKAKKDATAPKMTEDQKEAQVRAEKNIDDLMNDLIPPGTSGLPFATEGEDISRQQANVGRIQNALADIGEATGNENPTFDDLIVAMMDIVPLEKLSTVFSTIEHLYALANPDYQFTNQSLKEYLQLSISEKNFKKDKDTVDEYANKEQYSNKTDRDIDEDYAEVERITRANNNKKKTLFDYLRVESGSGILAYLARTYEQVFKKGVYNYKEISNELNAKMTAVDVNDPAKYGPGTKVRLVVEKDADDTDVYHEGLKQMTTWGQKKALWEADATLTDEEKQRKYNEQVPIAVYVGDKKIGYLHETTWITEANVSGDVEADRERNKEIRDYIISQEEFETTITDKSDGYLSRSSDGHHTVAEAFKGNNFELVVASNGQLEATKNRPIESTDLINKKEFREGVAYAVVPIREGKKLAIPLKSRKIGDDALVANTVKRALGIFYFGVNDEATQAIVDSIFEETKINITEADGIYAFLKMFFNDYATGSIGMNENYSSLEEYLNREGASEKTEDGFVHMIKRNQAPGQNDLYFEISRGKGADHAFMSKESLEKMGPTGFDEFIDKFTNNLNMVYAHVDLRTLGQNKKVAFIDEEGKVTSSTYEEYVTTMTTTPFLSHNVGTETEPKYTYTIQPVITMDFSGIEKVKDDPASDIKKYIEEYNRPDTTPERKGELEKLIAEDYTEGVDLISAEERRAKVAAEKKKIEKEGDPEGRIVKPKVTPTKTKKRRPRKGGLNFQDNQETDPTSGAKIPMTANQRSEMEAESEVRFGPDGELIGTVISELGVHRQQSMISHIRARALFTIFRSKRKVNKDKLYTRLRKEIIGDDLANAKLDLIDATEEGDQHEIKILEGEIAQYEMFDKHWDKLEALTTESLDRIGGIRLVYKDLERQAEEGGTVEQAEQQRANANWSDVNAFVTNPADGIAPKVKQFLSGITEVRRDENGQIVPAIDPYIGAVQIMDYQRVYELVQRLTPNIRPNYDQMIAEMEKHVQPFPFLREVIDKLNGANDEQIKNQFVSGLTNHYVNMKFIMFSQDDSGAFSLVEHESDANALARVIQGNWYRNLIQSANSGFVAEAPDEYAILADVKTKLAEEYRGWEEDLKKEPRTFPSEESMRNWLESFGIALADDTFRTLMDGEFVYRGRKQSLYSLLTFNNGLFKILYNKVDGPGATPIISSRILDDSVLKALALEDSKNQLNNFTNSHRSGSKTVYSFGQNKYFINRVRELTETEGTENELVKSLAKMPFSERSAWVEGLMEKVPEGEINEFRANFGYWVASLEPLKKKGSKSRDGSEMHNLSEAEIEVIKIGMLQSAYKDEAGKNNRIIQILYPTTSDKTTVVGLRIIAQQIEFTMDGELEDVSIEKLIDLIVRPEMLRIRTHQEQVKLDTEEERHSIDNKEYADGADQFLFFPTLNTLPGMWLANGDINPNYDLEPEFQQSVKNEVRRYFEHLVNKKLDNWTENEIGGDRRRLLDSKFMAGGGESNPLGKRVNRESRVKAAAGDMVFQYLIGNAEIAKVFTGDPAMYFKVHSDNKNEAGNRIPKRLGDQSINPNYNFVADAEETYINIGKRLAGDIAPGYEIAESSNDAENHYTQAFIADVKNPSLAALQLTKLLDGQEANDLIEPVLEKVISGEITQKAFDTELKAIEKQLGKKLVSLPYYFIDGADAQEYTTWEEHLYVMRQAGEITDDYYKKAFDALRNDLPLDPKVLAKVMQPMKPVYVDNIRDDKTGFERRVYIKSSSFPLLPQLTRGTDLENLRIAMERDNVRRVAYSTAVKVGNVTEPFNIFDDNGRIIGPDQITFQNSKILLNRKGFRIQQKVPYDSEKFEITKVTQASKNLFINMLAVTGFEFDGRKDWTGQQLQEKYHEIYNRLHEIEKEALLEEITLDGNPQNIDVDNLRALLLKEVRERSYPISDRELLVLDRELRSLAFAPSANKYEALMNSIVANKIVKLKFPGKSYVLGSEEGFINKLTSDEATGRFEESGIIFTDRWDGNTGLKPARVENGIRYAAQAIVPWKFKDHKGNILKMSDFTTEVNGRTVVDGKKLPEKVRQLFGMRIPNQGPNSQSWIEIVGFLPESSGDLFIATRDYVVQMGSDFDVDKIYTYMYSTFKDSDGVLIPHHDTKVNEKAALQNQILDIHIAIHKNNDQRVQEQIANPLGFWELGNVSDDINSLRRARETAETKEDKNNKLFTGLSDQYQRDKFKNAAAGKIGVGVFSQDSMLNAVAQGKDLTYVETVNKVTRNITVKFGNTDTTVSKGRMSDVYALDGVTYKSDVIAGYQSAAVDNEKEQILDKINVNKNTFSVIKILNQLGFGKEVPYFLSQDIIIDYVRVLERLNSSTSDFYGNREIEAFRIVMDMSKYKLSDDELEKANLDNKFADEGATWEKMREYIEKGELAPNYKAAQFQFLKKFRELSKMGKEIQKVQAAINTDSTGIGKTVMESQVKETLVFGLIESPIQGADRLVGEFKSVKRGEDKKYPESKGWTIRDFEGYRYAIRPTTINGQAIVHGLFVNNELWTRYFHYHRPAVLNLMKRIEGISVEKEDVVSKVQADRRLEIWKEMKSFIFSDPGLEFYAGTIEEERERLLYDRFTYEEYEENGELKTRQLATTNQESLATALVRFKKTKEGLNNNFLKLLEIDYQKNGDPSLINYRASTAEGSDETEIYVAFSDAFTREDENGNSPVIGTFQGKEYTLRNLAEDLVSYSYINGGIQEALQFVKYIPAAYLSNTPFITKLSNANLSLEIMDPAQLASRENEYYNISPFVEQYFQHHPELVRSVNIREDVAKGRIDKQTRSFKLNEKGFSKLRELIGGKQFSPPYLRVNVKGTTRNATLYKYVKGAYYQIDVLGKLGASEYDRTAKFQGVTQKSKIRRNQVVTPVVPKDPTGTTPEYGPVDHGGPDLALLAGEADNVAGLRDSTTGTKDNDSLMDNLINGDQQTTAYKKGVEKSRAVLNNIMQTESNPYNKALAQEIFNNMDQLPPSMQVKIVSGGEDVGTYRYIYTGTIDPAHTLTIFKDQIKDMDETEANSVYMHELLHGLTGYKLLYYIHENKKDQGSLDIIKGIKDSHPDFVMTDKDRKTAQEIETLLGQARKKLFADPKFKAEYDQFKSDLLFKTGYDASAINKYYGLTDIQEFVAVALTNPDFQRILDNVQYKGTKTFWEALRERLGKLLQSLGFDFTEGSILQHTVYETLNLITDRTDEFISDEGIDVIPGNIISSSVAPINPQRIIDDNQVEDHIKHCKGL